MHDFELLCTSKTTSRDLLSVTFSTVGIDAFGVLQRHTNGARKAAQTKRAR